MEVVVKYGGVDFLLKGNYTAGRKSGDRDIPDDAPEFELTEVYLSSDEETDIYFLFDEIEGGVNKLVELALESIEHE